MTFFEKKSKYQRLVDLSTHVIRLDVLHGSLKWKVTDLARVSRVSRSKIYENLGRNKTEMLEVALTVLLDELYSLSTEKKEFDQKTGPFGGLMRSRNLVMEHPELLSFYFRSRNRKDSIGEIIKIKEKAFFDHVAKSTGLKNFHNVLFIRTLIHGVSVAPFLDEQQVINLMNMGHDLVYKSE